MKNAKKIHTSKNMKERCFALLAWIYVIEYTTLYVRSNLIDNIFQIAIIMILFILSLMLNKRFRLYKISMIYIFLAASAFVPVILNLDIVGIYTGIAHLLPIFFLVIFLNAYDRRNNLSFEFVLVPIVYGTIVSLQGIALGLLKFFEYPLASKNLWVGKAEIMMRYYAYGLGSVRSWGKIAERTLWRIYGHYTEPSRFAGFLILPICFCFGLYKETRKKRYMMSMILMLICLIFTMSRAGYVSLLCAILFFSFMNSNKKRRGNDHTSTYDIMKLIFIAVIAIIGALFLLQFLAILSDLFPGLPLSVGIWNHSGKVTLLRPETIDLAFILPLLLKRPYGYGFGISIHGHGAFDTNLANAVAYWACSGGIVAIIILLILLWNLFIKYCIPCLKSDDHVKCGIGMAFTALTVQGLAHGNWSGPDYMIMVGLLVLIKNRQIK